MYWSAHLNGLHLWFFQKAFRVAQQHSKMLMDAIMPARRYQAQH